MQTSKKIFISHSSLDKEIVDQFIDKILRLGLGFNSADIACTSREDTGVRTGDDIRKFIKENIQGADFVFFMISDNYKRSEICLNEMGAAWATGRDVKPILLPNVEFSSIGWLYNINKGVSITDSAALDLLYEDICEKYGSTLKITTWNRHKGEFLNLVETDTRHESITQAIVPLEESEELDLLGWREVFDEKIILSKESIERIGNAFALSREGTNKSTRALDALNNNPNKTPAQTRPLLLKMANDTDKLSEVLETETPILKQTIEEALNACLKLEQFGVNDEEQLNGNKIAINGMIENMADFMRATALIRTTLQRDTVNLDNSYTKSKNRLIKRLSDLVDAMQSCINQANGVVMQI